MFNFDPFVIKMNKENYNNELLKHIKSLYEAYRFKNVDLSKLLSTLSEKFDGANVTKFDGTMQECSLEFLECMFTKIWNKFASLDQIGLTLCYAEQKCNNDECLNINFLQTLKSSNFAHEFDISNLITEKMRIANNCNLCEKDIASNLLSPNSNMLIFRLWLFSNNGWEIKAKRLAIPDTFQHFAMNQTKMEMHLYAVITHNAGARHYKCFLRCVNDEWYECNDESINDRLSSTVVRAIFEDDAYALIYVTNRTHLLKPAKIQVNLFQMMVLY